MALLGNVLYSHFQKYRGDYPELIQEIENSLYVDDLSLGGDDINIVYKKYEQCNGILKNANMNLRKFKSNSSELLNKIESVVKERGGGL